MLFNVLIINIFAEQNTQYISRDEMQRRLLVAEQGKQFIQNKSLTRLLIRDFITPTANVAKYYQELPGGRLSKDIGNLEIPKEFEETSDYSELFDVTATAWNRFDQQRLKSICHTTWTERAI